MPEIEYAFLADAAEVQPGQKFHVLGGGVSRLNGPSIPFVHPHLSLVVGLRLTSVERNREHELGFVMTGPDGSEVASASGKVVAHGPADPNDIVLNIAVDLWNLNLRAPGEHAVRIMIDGSERKRLPLFVTQSREGTPSAPEQRYLA
jgi:hypothetical protein